MNAGLAFGSLLSTGRILTSRTLECGPVRRERRGRGGPGLARIARGKIVGLERRGDADAERYISARAAPESQAPDEGHDDHKLWVEVVVSTGAPSTVT